MTEGLQLIAFEPIILAPLSDTGRGVAKSSWEGICCPYSPAELLRDLD
jgi:hypothetical protein